MIKSKDDNVRPSVELLRRCLSYDKDTGVITWLARPTVKSRPIIGREDGYLEKDGYRRIKICGRLYHSHVVSWAIYYGSWSDFEIDHIDVNPSNNKINNLREANRSQNKANMAAPKTNTSGFKGVSFDKSSGKWVARIRMGKGVRIRLGAFSNIDDAALAYQSAAIKHFGEFARFE